MSKKIEEELKKVKALVNIKYDEECFKIGDEFEVRKEDSIGMCQKGYIELLEELPVENEGE